MDVAAVRAAIAQACSSIPGLTCLPYVPDSIAPPVLYVQPDAITYDQAFGRGLDYIDLSIHVVVQAVDDLSSQQLLDAYLAGSGPQSVYAALAGARGMPGQSALGGVADDFHLTSAVEYQPYVIDNIRHLGVRLQLRVIGSGS